MYLQSYTVCDLPLDAGSCENGSIAWHYDGESMTCVAFTYTGCGGNGNRFQTKEQCERQCGEFKGVGECFQCIRFARASNGLAGPLFSIFRCLQRGCYDRSMSAMADTLLLQ